MATPKHAATIKKPALKKIVLVDVVAMTLTIVACLALNPALVKAIMLGFGVFFAPTIFFIWRAYRYTGAKYAKQVAQSLYIAEIGKFVLTISLLAVIFLMLPLENYWLIFAAYLCIWLVHQIACFYWVGKKPV